MVHQVDMRKTNGVEREISICTQLSLNVVWIKFFLTFKKWSGRQNDGKIRWNFVFFAWMNMKNLIINLWIFLVCSHVLHRLYSQTGNSNKSLFNFMVWGCWHYKMGKRNTRRKWTMAIITKIIIEIYFDVAITAHHQHSISDS